MSKEFPQETHSNSEATSLIQAIKNGDQAALHNLYRSIKPDFMKWMIKRYQLSSEEIDDLYHDVFIAFYENIHKGSLTEIKSSLKTYLFGIGKFMLFQKFKQKKKHRETEWNDSLDIEMIDLEFESKQNLNHRQKVMKIALSQLGATCQQLLTLFYYEKFPLEVIEHRMNYKNKDTVKSQKARCIKKLRQIIQEKHSSEIY